MNYLPPPAHDKNRIFFWITAPLTIILAICGVVAIHTVHVENLSKVEQTLSDEAYMAVHGVNNFFQRFMVTVVQAEINPVFEEYLSQPQAEPPSDLLKLMDKIWSVHRKNIYSTWIYSRKTGGFLQIKGAPEVHGATRTAHVKTWLDTLPNQGPFILPPYVEASTGKFVISIVTPVKDPQSGTLLGAFGVDIDPDLIPPLMKLVCRSKQDHNVLIAPDGTIIYHPIPQNIGKNIRNVPYSADILEALLARRKGSYHFTIDGVVMHGNLSSVDDSDWVVLSEISKSYISSLNTNTVALLSVCFLVAISLLVISIVLLRKFWKQLENRKFTLESEAGSRINTLINQEKLLWSVINIAKMLLAMKPEQSFGAVVNGCLSKLGKAMGHDRVYIRKDKQEATGRLYSYRAYQWNDETVRDHALEMACYDDMPSIKYVLDNGLCLNMRVADMAASEQMVLQEQGILSLLVAPIIIDGERWGFIGVDNCKSDQLFTDLEESLLLMSGFMLASAILKQSTEEHLREAEERTHLMFNAMPLACCFWDKNHQSLDCNDEAVRLFELNSKQEYLNNFAGLSPLCQPDGAISSTEIQKKISHAFATGHAHFEWVHQTLDGKAIPVDVTLIRLLFKNEHIVVSYTRDLSELKMLDEVRAAQKVLSLARDQALAHSRAKSEFLARMSHEIRTPMNAITGMAELLLREGISPKARDQVNSIRQASAHLLSIINGILDFSKIESGKLDITPHDYQLASLINDVINIIRVKVVEKDIQFTVDVDPNLPNNLIGDSIRIRQVMLNVLNNAVKYTDEGFVSLSIRCDRLDSGMLLLNIDVADSGMGIKEEDIPTLFDEFMQSQSSRLKKIEGTGLGLAITRGLCRAMGGDVAVRSVYGQGSTFSVTLLQEFSDPQCIASVTQPRDFNALLYEPRTHMATSIMSAIDSLGVRSTLVANQSDLHEKLNEETFTHIFMSSYLFDFTEPLIENLDAMNSLVVLTNYGETLNNTTVKTFTLPLHSISLANLFNGIPEGGYADVTDANIRFTAPKARILIVDDISTNLKVAEGLMAPFGMQIDVCKSGEKAIELVRHAEYDIIFMDHMMPGMDGIEATQVIRKLPGCKDTPVIALTANAVTGMREMFLSNGFSDFLAKPIEVSKLNGMLERWLPKTKQQKNISSESATPQETFTIKDVDVLRGINMTGGTVEQYLKVLSAFHRDGRDKLTQIPQSLGLNNIRLYTTHVHAIKSAAATIGAANVSQLALELETAANQGDPAFIMQNTPTFLGTLARLLDSIQKVLRKDLEEVAETIMHKDELLDTLQRLKAALGDMDAVTADKLINSLQDNNHGHREREAAMEYISEQVLLCEYEEAVSAIDKLMRQEAKEEK